ncbi:hypothetical protein [Nocardia sp. 348MFTsu5.1]|uniref:hypothetical protein n=1 Tax=Nocardia sp. 348MFTsu5.1 TaxID=1172185 RepID=UPI000381A1A1|nr:hypothetical protein [Nocardia sp. 348MFTsu5.1]
MTSNSQWGWFESTEEQPPAMVVSLPRPARPVPTVVIAGAAGGCGASVLSVLVADALAQAGHDIQWCALSTAASDAPGRIASIALDDQHSPAGAVLDDRFLSLDLADRIAAVSPAMGVVVDTGSVDGLAEHWPMDDLHPVLVIAARPDTANRSRTGALATLANIGALQVVTVVICCLDPWAAVAVGHQFAQALSGKVGEVVVWDYDPHLGLGGSIDPSELTEQTHTVVNQIAGLS